MSSAFVGMNVIRIGANIFSQVRGVLQSQVITNAILLTLTVDDLLVYCITRTIQMLNELNDATLIVKFVFLTISFVLEHNAYTAIQKREFLKTFMKNSILKLGCLKDFSIRLECGFRSNLVGTTDS